MESRQQKLSAYFQGVKPEQFKSKLILELLKYQCRQFWILINNFLKTSNQSLPQAHKLIVKLMDENTIKEMISNEDYKFLLFGQKMREQDRIDLFNSKCEYDKSFKFYILLDIWRISQDLPECLILKNMFIENPDLSMGTLFTHIAHQDWKIKIKAALKDKRQNQILNYAELKSALESILPVNMTQLQLLKDQLLKEGKLQKYLSEQIIVLAGKSGIGKSTLILWLLGYKLCVKLIDGNPPYFDIVPQDLNLVKEEHREIVGKASITSVTNNIHFARLNSQQLEKPVIFTDTPGSFDTRGETRQIFNYYLFNIQFLNRCKKIKMVQVVDMELLLKNTRIKNVKELSERLANTYQFENALELKDNLTMIFNKCNRQKSESGQYKDFEDFMNLLTQARYDSQVKFSQKQHQILKYFHLILEEENSIVVPSDFYQQTQRKNKLLKYLANKQPSNPQNILTKYLNPTLDGKINQNLQFYIQNIQSYIRVQQFELVLYYYTMLQTLAAMFERTILISPASQLIKDIFESYLINFDRITVDKSNKIYSNQDFINLKHYKDQLKIGEKFEPFFDQIKTDKSLNILKELIFRSYRQKMIIGQCNQQMIENYKQFLQLFQQKQDASLALIAKKQQLLRATYDILNKQQNYSQIDQNLQKVIEVTNMIKSFDPSIQSEAQKELKNTMMAFVQQKFQKLQVSKNLDIQICKRCHNLAVCFNQEVIPQKYIKIPLQDYLKLDQSEALAQFKQKLDEKKLVKQLSDQLVRMLQQFRLLLNQKKMSSKAVMNFKNFINSYFSITLLKNICTLDLNDLHQKFRGHKKAILNALKQYSQKLFEVLSSNNQWLQLQFRTQKLGDQIGKLELICEYLQQSCSISQFIDKIAQILTKCKEELTLTVNIKKINIQREHFLLVTNRYQKLQKMESISIPSIKQHLNQLLTNCQNYHHQLVLNIQNYLKQDAKLSKILFSVGKDSLINMLQFISLICEKMKDRIDQVQTLHQSQGQIYFNCQQLAQMPISYKQQLIIRGQSPHNQISFNNLIRIIQFCNQLAAISYFQRRFKEKDIRIVIVRRINSNLQKIIQEIATNDATSFFINSIQKKLQPLFQLEQIFKFHQTNQEFNQAKTAFKANFDKAWKKIGQKNLHRSPKIFQIRGFEDQRGVLEKFRITYLGNPYENEKVSNFSKFKQFMQKRIQNYRQNQSIKKQKLLNLSKDFHQIQRNLKDMNLNIQQLDIFVAILEDFFNQIISQLCESLGNLLHNHQILEASKLIMKKITKLRNNTCLPIKDPKIQQYSKWLQQRMQYISKIKLKFQATDIDIFTIYESYHQIVVYTKNGLLPQVKNKISSSLKRQVEALAGHNQEFDFMGFGKKYKILKIVIYNLYNQKEIKRNNILNKLESCQGIKSKKLKDIIDASNLDNYKGFLEFIYQSRQFNLYDQMHRLESQCQSFLCSLTQKLDECRDLSSMFSILSTYFWTNQLTQQVRLEFKAKNIKRQSKFIKEILEKVIYPQIQQISDQLKRTLVIQAQINTKIFIELMKILQDNSIHFYDVSLAQKIENQIIKSLDTLRNKYTQKYNSILNVKYYQNFSSIKQEVRFAHYFQTIINIITALRPDFPISQHPLNKQNQFKSQLQDSYNHLLAFKFTGQQFQSQAIRSDLEMQIYFQGLQNILMLFKNYNSQGSYNQLIATISGNLKARIAQNITFLQQIFIRSIPYKLQFKLLMRNIQLDNILPRIKDMRLHQILELNIDERSSLNNKIRQVLMEGRQIDQRWVEMPYNQRIQSISSIGFYVVKLKKISLFFKQFTLVCEGIISNLLKKINSDRECLRIYKNTIQTITKLSIFHQFAASQLYYNTDSLFQHENDRQGVFVQSFAEYPYYRDWINYQISREQTIQEIYSKFYENETVQQKYIILLSLFSSIYPQIKFDARDYVFKIARELGTEEKVQMFLFNKLLQIPWKQKNIISIIFAAMLRIQNYQVYLIYSSEQKKEYQKNKYSQFFIAVEKIANIIRDKYVIFTTFDDLFNDYTHNIQFQQEIINQLYKREYSNRQRSEKKVFIIQDYHQVFADKLFHKKYEFYVQIKQQQLLHELCQQLKVNKDENSESIFQNIKMTVQYQKMVEKYTPLKRIIDIQLRKIIKCYLRKKLNLGNDYQTCNKSLYYKEEGKFKNALTTKDKNYESMFISFDKRKINALSHINYTELLKIRFKLFQISAHKFISYLRSKYKLVAFSLLTKCSLGWLSEICFNIEKKLINNDMEFETKNNLIPSLSLRQFHIKTLIQCLPSSFILFEDYKAIDIFIKSNGLHERYYENKLQRVDQTMDSEIIKLKLKAFPFLKKSLLITNQSIKMVSSSELFYPKKRQSLFQIFFTYVPKNQIELQRTRQNLNFLNAQIEFILIYDKDGQRISYQHKLAQLVNHPYNNKEQRMIESINLRNQQESIEAFFSKTTEDIIRSYQRQFQYYEN